MPRRNWKTLLSSIRSKSCRSIATTLTTSCKFNLWKAISYAYSTSPNAIRNKRMSTSNRPASWNTKFNKSLVLTPNLSKASLETKSSSKKALSISNKRKNRPLLTSTKELRRKIIGLKNSSETTWTRNLREYRSTITTTNFWKGTLPIPSWKRKSHLHKSRRRITTKGYFTICQAMKTCSCWKTHSISNRGKFSFKKN